MGTGPACAIEVVGAPLGGIGEDSVGSDDETITVELRGMGEGGGGRGVWVAVGMVEFHELVEGLLGVRGFFGRGEDLVGCWVGGSGPGGGRSVRRGIRRDLGGIRLTTVLNGGIRA